MKTFPTLYSRASSGAVQQWTVFTLGDSFWSEAGQVGGAITKAAPTTCKGKNPGKANETTPEAQAEKEAEAKFKKKLKENYFEDIADIDKGFLEPQLAKSDKDLKYAAKLPWEDGVLRDDKLNGFACIITARGAYTRTNEEYHSIPHILESFNLFFQQNPDAYLQGELFNPIYVNELNKIAELIAVTRKPKDIDAALLAESARIVQFHCYDGYNFNGVEQATRLFERRLAIDDVISYMNKSCVQSVKYDICYKLSEAEEHNRAYVKRGGEGSVLKNPNAPYQHKRTSDLTKLKKLESAEFRVVNDVENPFEEGKGNSAGCGEAVWVLLNKTATDGRDRFKVNIKGAKDRLRAMYKQPQSYKNQWITVEFQEYSPFGIPLIPYTDMVLRELVEGKGAVNASEQPKLDIVYVHEPLTEENCLSDIMEGRGRGDMEGNFPPNEAEIAAMQTLGLLRKPIIMDTKAQVLIDLLD